MKCPSTQQEFTMQALSPALSPSLSQPLQASWALRSGQALSLRPRAAGVFRVTQGRAWATLDVDRRSPASDTGDHFVMPGQDLVLRAGQRVVLEAWPVEGDDAIALQWMPAAQQGSGSRWQASVVEPLHDLGRGLALVVRASLRLVRGLAGYATTP
jgi:hypothetical protein